jgi:cysteinyl-tRNA synthetase
MKLFNTMTRRKEELVPIAPPKVGFYTCGPTVYNRVHIGNLRTFLFEDLLRRWLRFRGFEPYQVMNLTDVDDKTIRGASEQGVSLDEYTAPYIELFFEDIKKLNIEPAEVYPRATLHIAEMVELVKQLRANGLTYESEGSIYFSIGRFPDYGKLSGIRPNELKCGVRVELDEYEKDDARDFVLWKAAKPGEPSWDTELGKGRPGWHIECSAMSMKYLGETLDIHTGGVDNMFPHHENELAQSEAATGKPFVKYWMHAEHLLVDGEKMSKSKGNFYTLGDLLEKGIDPVDVRFALLQTHYRSQYNFTLEGVAQARAGRRRLQDFYARLGEVDAEGLASPEVTELASQTRQRFVEAGDDDLNIPEALGQVFAMMPRVNSLLDENKLTKADAEALTGLLEDFDSVLGALERESQLLDADVEALMMEREQARKDRNFARSDEIRDLLKAQGILLEDTAKGTRWKRE